MSLGPLEILLIVVLIALLFGAKKLPELMKGAGQGIREFKKEVHADGSTTSTEVTDVASRQLDPVTGQPVTTHTHTTQTTERR